MKKLIIILWLLLVLSLLSCKKTEVNYSNVSGSFITWPNLQEFVEFSDAIMIGKIKDISFQVLDLTTSRLPTEKTADRNRYLFTVCDVEVIKSYKGEVNKSVQIYVMGGLKDYLVERQLEALVSGKGYHYEDNDIPILDAIPKIRIGDTYLFTVIGENPMFYMMTPKFTFFPVDNPFRKNITSSGSLDDPSIYSESRINGRHLTVSAKDIITECGEDQWKEFWAQWQKENPDWETTMNKAAVEKALGMNTNEPTSQPTGQPTNQQVDQQTPQPTGKPIYTVTPSPTEN